MQNSIEKLAVNIMPAMDVYKSGHIKMKTMVALAGYDHRASSFKKTANSKDILGTGQNYVLLAVYLKGEDVKIESSQMAVVSWYSPDDGFLLRRNTEIFTLSGEKAGSVVQYFIPFDVQKRKAFHPDDEQRRRYYSFLKVMDRSPSDNPRSRAERASDPVFCERRKVRDSEMDYMGHLNSAVYYDYVFDVLDEEARTAVLGESVMSYHRELLKDGEVDIYKETTLRAITVEGRIPETGDISFICEILLKK